MVCDDVPELRDLLRFELEEDGDVEVVAEADDGPGALRAIAECLPDVVLLDLSMPNLDGLEVLQRLRRDGPKVRVVVFLDTPTP